MPNSKSKSRAVAGLRKADDAFERWFVKAKRAMAGMAKARRLRDRYEQALQKIAESALEGK